MLEHLASAAVARGIGRFVADVLPDNHRMIGVFRSGGLRRARPSRFRGYTRDAGALSPAGVHRAGRRTRMDRGSALDRAHSSAEVHRRHRGEPRAGLGGPRHRRQSPRRRVHRRRLPGQSACRLRRWAPAYCQRVRCAGRHRSGMLAVPAHAPGRVPSAHAAGRGFGASSSSVPAKKAARRPGQSTDRDLVELARSFGMRLVGPRLDGRHQQRLRRSG